VLLGRVIDGASGASVSVAQAAATDLARTPVERARLVGLLGASFGVGFVAGPAIGALGAIGGPAVPFFIAAAIAGINALVALKRLPETRPVVDLNSAVEPLPDAVEESSNSDSKRLSVRMLIAAAGLVTASFAAFEATFSLVVQDELLGGLSESERLMRIGLLFAAIGVLIVGVQAGLVRRSVARLGEYRTLLFGLAALMVGFATLAAFSTSKLLLLSVVPLAVGQGLSMAALSAMLGGSAHAQRRGRAFGVQQRSAGIGRVVGPIVGGAALSLAGSGAPAMFGLVVTVGVFALVALRPQPHPRQQPQPAP
jgi:MFS family permease